MKKLSFIIGLSLWGLLLSGCRPDEETPFTEPTTYDSTALHAGLDALDLERYHAITYQGHHPSVQDAAWEIFTYDTSSCRCILGDTVTISLHQTPGVRDIVFMMQGGGACWPGMEDCSTLSTDGTTNPENLTSLDPRNPVAGWNKLFVPYCDGSVHMGDNAADYDTNGIPDHWHWGLRQTTAALNLMKEKFDTLDRVLITGCSAGGYGTILATLLIRNAYPAAKIYVFNESGPGLFDPDNPQTFETIKATWNIHSLLPADCPSCSQQLMYIYDWLLARDSRLYVGLYSSYEDHVIGSSYLNMTPQAFNALLMEVSGEIHTRHPTRFKRFFIKGSTHCIADYLKSVDGVSLAGWIGQLTREDPAWSEHFE